MSKLEDLQRQGCIVLVKEVSNGNVRLRLEMNNRVAAAVIQNYKLIGLTDQERKAVIQNALECLAEGMWE